MYLGNKRRTHPKSFRWFGDRFNHYIDSDHFMGINPLEDTRHYQPPVNIKQTDEHFDLELSVPGFKRDEIKIEVDKNVLTIKGKKTEDVEGAASNYIKKEHAVTSFERSFELHPSTDAENITADYQDGMLRIRLKHKPQAEPKSRKISVE